MGAVLHGGGGAITASHYIQVHYITFIQVQCCMVGEVVPLQPPMVSASRAHFKPVHEEKGSHSHLQSWSVTCLSITGVIPTLRL